MAGNNTEKPTGKAQAKKTTTVKEPKKTQIDAAPIKKEIENKEIQTPTEENPIKEEVKEEKKKIVVKKVKKNSATINVLGVAASTKYSIAICKFIKHKTIEQAIKDLEQVSFLKKAVPMKGEIPHRKGPMMSGRFPVRASKLFITLLKSLQGNAINHDVENPIISEAIANKGTTTYAKGGRARKKRTNVKIVCISKKEKNKEKKK